MKNKRILTLMFCISTVYLFLIARVFYIQVIKGKSYAVLAEKQAVRRKILTPKRGEILDRYGKRMAINASVRVSIDKSQSGQNRDVQRVAPNGHVAGQIIGNVGNEGYGQTGLEYSFDQKLRGDDGYEYIRITVDRKYHPDFKGQRLDPVDGKNVLTSLDLELQKVAEQALERGVRRVQAKRGCAILVDPHTGDILAMANYPFFNPNRRSAGDMKSWKNFAISDLYEPGSTFKSFTSAAVFQEGVVKPQDPFFAENGVWKQGVALIKDSKPMGNLTFTEAFAYSSNIVMVKASFRLKADVFYQYIRSFGFGIRTGIKLPGEEGGVLRAPRQWNARSHATLSWGQELSVTPLQLAMAGAALANGGILLRPRLILGLKNSQGQWVEKTPVQGVRRAISPHTAQLVRQLMKAVVDTGTAHGIKSEQFSFGGKTGTAEKINPETGMYMPGHFNSSFLGMVPVESPRLVALVIIDEPLLEKHGGRSAAPIFKEIMERAAGLGGAYTALLTKTHDTYDKVLISKGKQTSDSQEQNFNVLNHSKTTAAQITKETSQSKKPVVIQAAFSLSQLYSEQSSDEKSSSQAAENSLNTLAKAPEIKKVSEQTGGPMMWSMPDLSGKSLRAALQSLAGMPLSIKYKGQGWVLAQEPAPGSVVGPGQKCILHLGWEKVENDID